MKPNFDTYTALIRRNIIMEDGSEVSYKALFLDYEKAKTFTTILIKEIQWENIGKREVHWIGDSEYQYGSTCHTRNNTWHGIATMIMGKINLEYNDNVNSVLLNLYRSGDNWIPYHSDDETIFGKFPIIYSVSLGADRSFILRHKATLETVDINLTSGSLLIMKGKTQQKWQHSLPAVTCDKPRVNLTFRKLILPA